MRGATTIRIGAQIAVDTYILLSIFARDGPKHSIQGRSKKDFGYLGRTAFIMNHAIVFLIRELHDKWKQPVGYFLSSGTMNGQTMATLLKDCISKVENCGLSVKVIISDQGSNNRNMS